MFYSAKLRIHEAWRATYHACGTILILAPLYVQIYKSFFFFLPPRHKWLIGTNYRGWFRQNTLNAEQCQLFWIAYLQERYGRLPFIACLVFGVILTRR